MGNRQEDFLRKWCIFYDYAQAKQGTSSSSDKKGQWAVWNICRITENIKSYSVKIKILQIRLVVTDASLKNLFHIIFK